MPQSFANVPVHLVFSTKHRQPFLKPEREVEVHRYIAGVLKNHNCQPIRIGGFEDHVHILYRLSRTMTMAQVTEKVKTGSTKWARIDWHMPEFQWQDGYGSFGVGVRDIDMVVRYIENQKVHHRTVSFKEEFLELLAEYGIEYDERYIWD